MPLRPAGLGEEVVDQVGPAGSHEFQGPVKVGELARSGVGEDEVEGYA